MSALLHFLHPYCAEKCNSLLIGPIRVKNHILPLYIVYGDSYNRHMIIIIIKTMIIVIIIIILIQLSTSLFQMKTGRTKQLFQMNKVR